MPESARSPLDLSRSQILAFRRRVGALDERLPRGSRSLRRAAWAGLQDSMPRAALLSIHARVEGAHPSSWEDPSLVQIWGPRFSTYVVPARDHAVFTLGRLPDERGRRDGAEDVAARLHAFLDGRRMGDGEAGRALGVQSESVPLRRADGHGPDPLGRRAAADDLDRPAARGRPARRAPRAGPPVPARLRPDNAGVVRHLGGDRARRGGCGVRRPQAIADARADTDRRGVDPGARRAVVPCAAEPAAAARLLPSGDAYYLLQGADRELLVPDAKRRGELWTSRVWPGAVLVAGEIVGTWRRAQANLTIQTWKRLSRAARDVVEAEAAGLPLPGVEGRITIRWDS